MASAATVTSSASWFEVDRPGLSQLLERRGKGWVIFELIQNSWDAEGTTAVEVELAMHALHRGRAVLTVRDDSPDGWRDLTHAYRLFAPSEKKSNPEKRGRFNLGEKMILALCDTATVVSTTGGVRFDVDGHRYPTNQRRHAGSEFTAVIRMTSAEMARALQDAHVLLPPVGIRVTVNGVHLRRTGAVPVHRLRASLTTEAADDAGVLRRVQRMTEVILHDPLPGEPARLFERGIPVQELPDDAWDVDVQQRVPVTMERDGVSLGYLRAVRVAVANVMASRIDSEQASRSWVVEALGDSRIDVQAVRSIVRTRFGGDAFIHAPSDPEATRIAVSKGGRPVYGGALPAAAWANVKAADALVPAAPSPRVTMESSRDGEPLAIPEEEWSDGMRSIRVYVETVSRLLGRPVTVAFASRIDQGADAWWSAASRTMWLNVVRLGRQWVDRPDQQAVDALLLHELGHDDGTRRQDPAYDHCGTAYGDNVATLGAALCDLIRDGRSPVLGAL